MPDMNQHGFGLAHPGAYGDSSGYPNLPNEAFPNLQQSNADMSQMAPPSINIDYAPNNARAGGYDGGKSIDQDSLTPPERGTCEFLDYTSI